MTDPHCSDPENNIGPYYKALGAVCLVAALVMALLQVRSGHRVDWPDVVLYGIVALVVLALIRPSKFDAAMKTAADHLPGAYTKPPVSP